MSELMLHGILNAPCEAGDFVGVSQLKDAAKRASLEITALTEHLRLKEEECKQLQQDLEFMVDMSRYDAVSRSQYERIEALRVKYNKPTLGKHK